MTLRQDTRQWLIYERGPIEATVRALEVLALGMVGRRWAKHPHQSVKALGNVMMRLADARARTALGLVNGEATTPERNLAMQWALKVSHWVDQPQTEPPMAELDELHAAAFQLDSRLHSAGLSGNGWLRDLGRGD